MKLTAAASFDKVKTLFVLHETLYLTVSQQNHKSYLLNIFKFKFHLCMVTNFSVGVLQILALVVVLVMILLKHLIRFSRNHDKENYLLLLKVLEI